MSTSSVVAMYFSPTGTTRRVVARIAKALSEEIRGCTEETRQNFPRDSRPVLGVGAILRTDPHHRPGHAKKSPAPLCHAATRAGFLAYREKYRMFVEAFRDAATWLREKAHGALSEVGAIFPPYAFPPSMPMVMPSG